MPSVIWFRRDLRLSDHGALAAAGGDRLVGLFVVDRGLLASVGVARRGHLFGALRDLDEDIRRCGGAGLLIRAGDPRVEVPAVAAAHGAESVLVTGEYTPYGLRRDAAVAAALADQGVRLTSVDTPYLHPPGTVVKGNGGPFSVFTPFWRVWSALSTPPPVHADAQFVTEFAIDGEPIPSGAVLAQPDALLEGFLSGPGELYSEDRNRVDLPGTSQLGAALHFGQVHPRTIVAACGPGFDGFVRQLCWREFYADVLWRRPDAAWGNVDRRFDAFPWRDDRAAFDLWCQGRTGYPLVDAGMRQLSGTGWMHNRSRMVVASFLTKDLLLPWQWGAKWLLTHLRDGDVANNSLGWQWVAGTGTDAAPYYRVFNPVLQGQKFDPQGDYVRQFVPELAHLPGVGVHTPWDQPDGYANGYSRRIVDHAEARAAALAAYDLVKTGYDATFERRPVQISPPLDGPLGMILRAHPTLVSVELSPRRVADPGLLYVLHPPSTTGDVVLADSLDEAIGFIQDDQNPGVWDPQNAYWVSGSREDLRSSSPALRTPRSAARVGRPILIGCEDDWRKAPSFAGVYRINIADADGRTMVYIGRSGDLARRPRRHEKIPKGIDGKPKWGEPGVTSIELLPVRASGHSSVWTSRDLDELEAQHVARAILRYGKDRVINETVGRNGPPSRPARAQHISWAPA